MAVAIGRKSPMGKSDGLEAKIGAQLKEWVAELESLKARADEGV